MYYFEYRGRRMKIEDYPKTMEVINGIVNNHHTAEVKIEKDKLVVVELGRAVRSQEELKNE